MGPVVGGHAAVPVCLEDSAGVRPRMKSLWLRRSGVVVDQPGVGFGLELADGGEPSAVEGRAPAFLEGGALEPFAHGVVVRGSGRDPVVGQAQGGQAV